MPDAPAKATQGVKIPRKLSHNPPSQKKLFHKNPSSSTPSPSLRRSPHGSTELYALVGEVGEFDWFECFDKQNPEILNAYKQRDDKPGASNNDDLCTIEHYMNKKYPKSIDTSDHDASDYDADNQSDEIFSFDEAELNRSPSKSSNDSLSNTSLSASSLSGADDSYATSLQHNGLSFLDNSSPMHPPCKFPKIRPKW